MEKLSGDQLNRVDVETFKKLEKTPVIVILDNIRSLNNIGSVFRTCDAFAIEKIYLCGITATPPHKDIHKTALGATQSVDWQYEKDTKEVVMKLKSQKITIVCVEQTSNSVMLDKWEVENGQKYAVVFGNEVDGVCQEVLEISDFALEVPQFGTKHSLNVSVCAGVVLWDFIYKLKLKN